MCLLWPEREGRGPAAQRQRGYSCTPQALGLTSLRGGHPVSRPPSSPPSGLHHVRHGEQRAIDDPHNRRQLGHRLGGLEAGRAEGVDEEGDLG